MDFDLKIYNFISDCQNYILTQDESKSGKLLAFPDTHAGELKVYLADYKNIRYLIGKIFQSPIIDSKQLEHIRPSPQVLKTLLSLVEKLEKNINSYNILITQELVLNYATHYYEKKETISAFGVLAGVKSKTILQDLEISLPQALDFLASSMYQKNFAKPKPVISRMFRLLYEIMEKAPAPDKKEKVSELITMFMKHFLIPTNSQLEIQEALKYEYNNWHKENYDFIFACVDKLVISQQISPRIETASVLRHKI